MRRVLVMGCSGSGKSTFAMALSKRLGLPHVSLDALFWQPGWVESEPAAFAARATEAAAGEAWIIDGNYTSHGGAGLRRERADTVFWFDLPRRTCMAGILRRIASTYGRVRPDMAPGCPERLEPAFLRWVWTYRARQRPKLVAWLAGLRPDQRLVTFTTRQEADRFLASAAGA